MPQRLRRTHWPAGRLARRRSAADLPLVTGTVWSREDFLPGPRKPLILRERSRWSEWSKHFYKKGEKEHDDVSRPRWDSGERAPPPPRDFGEKPRSTWTAWTKPINMRVLNWSLGPWSKHCLDQPPFAAASGQPPPSLEFYSWRSNGFIRERAGCQFTSAATPRRRAHGAWPCGIRGRTLRRGSQRG